MGIDTVVVAPRVNDEPQLAISWTAIFSGWLVALGFAWLFYVAGVAVGFSAFDVDSSEATAKGIGIGTTIWVILTWAVSLFLGGMFASWVDARPNTTVGALHGVAVWGLASSVTLLLAALGFTGLLQGAGGLLKTSAAAAASATSSPAESPLGRAGSLLSAQLNRALAQTSARQGAPSGAGAPPSGAISAGAPASPTTPVTTAVLSREAGAAVSLDLLRGRNDEAKARLAAESGLAPAEVDSVLQAMSAQVERSRTQIKEAAEQARRYTVAALWAVVLSIVIGLIGAAIGGSIGAARVADLHDDRNRR